jgi:hypothetical protein
VHSFRSAAMWPEVFVPADRRPFVHWGLSKTFFARPRARAGLIIAMGVLNRRLPRSMRGCYVSGPFKGLDAASTEVPADQPPTLLMA